MPPVMDDLDTRMLELLRTDGRMPTLALARCLGIAEATARKRLKRLLDMHMVEIVAVANSRMLGYIREIVVAMRVRPVAVDRLAEKFSALPAVRFVGEGTGAFNLWVNVAFHDQQDEVNFSDQFLKGDPDIIEVQTMNINRVRRRSFDWVMGDVGLMKQPEATAAVAADAPARAATGAGTGE